MQLHKIKNININNSYIVEIMIIIILGLIFTVLILYNVLKLKEYYISIILIIISLFSLTIIFINITGDAISIQDNKIIITKILNDKFIIDRRNINGYYMGKLYIEFYLKNGNKIIYNIGITNIIQRKIIINQIKKYLGPKKQKKKNERITIIDIIKLKYPN